MDNFEKISEIIGVFISNTYFNTLYDKSLDYYKNNKFKTLKLSYDAVLKSFDNNLNKVNSIDGLDYYKGIYGKIYENYCNDIKTKRAIEREIEIIGEATNRILKKDNNFNITNARKIISTRNRIIHGYDSLSDDMIWGIIINHLPKLKIEIKNLLKE